MSLLAHDGQMKDAYWQRLGLPWQGEHLLGLVRLGFPFAVWDHLISVFQLTSPALRAWLSMSPSTLRRRRQHGRFNSRESDQLFQIALVLVHASCLFEGDTGMANGWMDTPQYGLGGRRPKDMLATAVERQALLTLIGQVEHGVLS